jgi:Flp pilus assembly protein TadB
MFHKNARSGAYFEFSGTRAAGSASSGASISHRPRQLQIRSRFDLARFQPETSAMTITSAHIPAIVALIAGILILVMPRLLNFIVAIYLICVGLIGLGALKFLHL